MNDKNIDAVAVLREAVEQAAEAWATAEFQHAKSLCAGGPGRLDAAHKAENAFRAALAKLVESAPAQGELSDVLPKPWKDRLYVDAATWGDEGAAMAAEIADWRSFGSGQASDAAEGLEILDDLIRSIEQHGNYSKESTLVFLGQLRQCFAPIAASSQQSTRGGNG